MPSKFGNGTVRAAVTHEDASDRIADRELPEVPHNDPAETAAHDATGAVKMQTDINDICIRLFAADKAEIPWFVSLYQNVRDLIRPEKLPPLVLTSKPVAVKSIWGLYAGDPKSRYISVGVHVAAFALMMVTFTNKVVQQKLKDTVNLIDPNLKPYVAPPQKKEAGGGGGGARGKLPLFPGVRRPNRR